MTYYEWIEANMENIVDLFRDFRKETSDAKTTVGEFAEGLYKETKHYPGVGR